MVHVTDEMQKAGLTMSDYGREGPRRPKSIRRSRLRRIMIIRLFMCWDASQNPLIAAKLLNPETKDAYVAQLNREYEALRASLQEKREELVPLAYAREHKPVIDWKNYVPVVPSRLGVQVIPSIPIEAIIPYIHWTFFFQCMEIERGVLPKLRRFIGCDACRAAWLAAFPEADREKAAEGDAIV